MRKNKSNGGYSGATKPVSKVCAWILSIMLVVTGVSPSFAKNAKANKADEGTVVSASVNAAKEGSKAKKPKVSSAKKAKKDSKASEEKLGKKKKIGNKRAERFDLNASGNVYASLDAGTLTVKATDPSTDAQIDRVKWGEMITTAGGSYTPGDEASMSWTGANCSKIVFDTSGISLPKDSSHLFSNFGGEVEGCQNLKTDNVTNMSGMFYEAKLANPNVSNWNTANVTDMKNMFFGAAAATPDVSGWDVSNVTTMYYMFCKATAADPNVTDWKVSNVTDMHGMFDSATTSNPDVSKWDVSNVTDMHGMFRGARLASPNVADWKVTKVTDMNEMFRSSNAVSPDVSKWNVSNVKNMKGMFKKSAVKKLDLSIWTLNQELLNDSAKMQNMFETCKDMEFLKTPKGLKTDMSGADNDFEIVKLKKGAPASVEQKSHNLNAAYQINEGNDKDALYHIYRSDKYAGVFFDKYHGENESWVNHEIAEKGKSIKASKGSLPTETPTLASNEFVGWAKAKNATAADFDENTQVDEYTTVYAAWRDKQKVNITFEAGDGTGNMEAVQEDRDGSYKLPECGFTAPDGKEFDKWSVVVGSDEAVEKMPNDEIVASDNVTVTALWKNKPIPKVNVTFNAGDGGTGNMDAVEVNKASNYKLPECGFTAPDGKEFDKWSVVIGSEEAVEKMPNDEIVASDNVTVTALWKNKPIPKVNVTFNAGDGGMGNMDAVEVNKGSNYKLPECGFTAPDGKKFDKWSVVIGSEEAVEKMPNDEIVVSDNVTVTALWKDSVEPPAPGKVRVTLDGNGGVLAGGASATIDVDNGSSAKEQLEAAVANKIFTKDEYKLVGFSRSKFATQADYNVDSPVYSNMTLYAVYEEAPVFTDVTIKYTEVGMDEDEIIENVREGKAIGDKLDGHERALEGHRFLGYSKEKNAVKPDFFKKDVVTKNLVLYPVYKDTGSAEKVKVAFKFNDGTNGSLKTEEVAMYEPLGSKMPAKSKVPARDEYVFTGWAKSKAAKYPDFFRGTVVKGHMTVYAIWKSLYDEKLGQAVLKVAAKAKGYELTIEPPKANLHTGFDVFRSEEKDFKPSKDNKIATVDRNTLKYLDDKADNGKAYYYAVRAINADGSYNGTKVTFIGKLSDSVLAVPLPKDKGVTATVAGKGAVSLEFNKAVAAAKYKITVTAPYDKKFKEQVREIEADKVVAVGEGKVKANITGLPMGKLFAFKLEALANDGTKVLEYGNSFAFMMDAVEKLTAKVNKKSRVLNVKFKAMKGASGYEAKIVMGGKVKTIKLKKGAKKLKGLIVGSIKLPKKKGNYTFTIRAFKKIGKLKYYGQTITKVVR